MNAPRGCCVKVLSDQSSLLVNLSGLIDVDAEVARLASEVERLFNFYLFIMDIYININVFN